MSINSKTLLTLIVATLLSSTAIARDKSQVANQHTALPEAGIGWTAAADSLPNFTFKKHNKVEISNIALKYP